MTDTHVSRIVIEFYTDSEEEHNDMTERIAEYADDVMCGDDCNVNTCRLVGITAHRLTLEQFDKELED